MKAAAQDSRCGEKKEQLKVWRREKEQKVDVNEGEGDDDDADLGDDDGEKHYCCLDRKVVE